MTRTRLAVVVGSLAVFLGIGVAVEPGIARGVGTDRAILAVIGVVAGYLGFRALRKRQRAGFSGPALPEVESKYEFGTAGAALTGRLHAAAATKRGKGRQQVREELHRTTVVVLTTYREYTESEAKAAIEDGSWTDDPYAAAFFTLESPPRPLAARLGDVLQGRTAFERRANHVIAELDDLTKR